MAKLFINKDIAADADKMMYWLSGDDCVSFNDVQSFLDYYNNEERIDVELHSCGGSCIEGYAIYDALRASGKEISCTVVGTCASMATVILLAAPKERRAMYPNARLLIHNPHFASFEGMATIESLNSALSSLQSEKERMLAIYTERTGMTREVLEAQMATDDWFGSDKAIELGFVSYVIPAASASINNNKKKKEMNGKKVSVAEAFKMLGIALGLAKGEAEGLTITTSTGDKLEINRDGGDPQVGDEASPDGTHVLEDGRTIVVEDGKITEIREASEETESHEENEGAEASAAESNEEAEGASEAEANGNDEVKTLQEENESLKAQIIQLQGEVDSFKAVAKSEEENRILDAVAKAGGEEWLKKAAASTYVPAGRSNNANVPEVRESIVEKRLAEAREKNKKRFERK